jgi:hypothetical protein
MTITRFTLSAATVLVVALAACSTPAAVDPTAAITGSATNTSVNTTSETATTTLAELTSDVPATSSTSDAPTTEVSPPTEVPPTTEAPASPIDGFGLAGQDLADAQAAWDAYQVYDEFSRQAVAAPGADWSGQIASLMGFPADEDFQKTLTGFAKLQITVDDKTRAEITKIDVKPDFIIFSACIDATETKSFDKDGKDITAPDAPGSYKRHPGDLWMERQNGVWRFVDSKSDFQTQC